MKYKFILLIVFSLLFSGCSNIDVDVPCETDNFDNCKTSNLYQNIALGNIENTSAIHKFGSGTLTTTLSIISQSGTYMTPTTPQTLEFVSTSANDTFLGTGAREITIQGLNSSWEEETITIQTNGTTAVVLPIDFLRVYRWWVSSSGTYASPGTTSYVGDLMIQEVGGGALWTIIRFSPITTGQSQIGVYTIPKGKTAYLLSKNLFTDTSKTADIYFFFRENADDVTAPFSGARRIIEREVGISGGFETDFLIPKGPFIGPADIGMFGGVSQGTAEVSIEFQLMIVDSE